MARRTYQQDYGWGSVLPAGTAQPDLPPAEVYGPAVILTNHREFPLSERRMVLYTYSAPDVSPADPCNKMVHRGSSPILTPAAGCRRWRLDRPGESLSKVR